MSRMTWYKTTQLQRVTPGAGESNVGVESESESETNYDMGSVSGSERGDDSDDFSEDEESDSYATL